jgi:hypothetical protein
MAGWHETLAWLFSGREISIPVKIIYSLFICILVPVYWRYHGPANFLWFSDLALLFTGAALWLESPFLASMQAVSVVLLELVWIVDFVTRLATGYQLIGIADYMFQTDKPLFVRALSLFHILLPFLLVWLVYRLGYEQNAWIAQSVLAWVVLLVCFFFTEPSKNINWVFGLGKQPQAWFPPGVYLIMLMAVFPICIYFPTHLALRAIMAK